VYRSPTLFTITKQLSDLSWNMQARSGILASHLNSQTHLNQFSIELVKSSTEAENTVFANCSALKLDSLHILRQQQTKKRFNRIMNKSEHCLH